MWMRCVTAADPCCLHHKVGCFATVGPVLLTCRCQWATRAGAEIGRAKQPPAVGNFRCHTYIDVFVKRWELP